MFVSQIGRICRCFSSHFEFYFLSWMFRLGIDTYTSGDFSLTPMNVGGEQMNERLYIWICLYVRAITWQNRSWNRTKIIDDWLLIQNITFVIHFSFPPWNTHTHTHTHFLPLSDTSSCLDSVRCFSLNNNITFSTIMSNVHDYISHIIMWKMIDFLF
jgi:hypothetical protein